jgi:hypothetical protein
MRRSLKEKAMRIYSKYDNETMRKEKNVLEENGKINDKSI